MKFPENFFPNQNTLSQITTNMQHKIKNNEKKKTNPKTIIEFRQHLTHRSSVGNSQARIALILNKILNIPCGIQVNQHHGKLLLIANTTTSHRKEKSA